MKTVSIEEILAFLDETGLPYSFEGNSKDEIVGFSSLTNRREDAMVWVKSAAQLPPAGICSSIRLAIVSPDAKGCFRNTIVSPESKRLFFSVLEHFYGEAPSEPGIGTHTYVGPHVRLGKHVTIGHNCTLDGEIDIADGVIIGNNVSLMNRIHIGEASEIRSGVVIGHADSIAYTEDAEHNKLPVPHFGGVWIGSRVMIGENSSICRGTLDDTVLMDGVRLDAQTMVSHNCRFMKNSVAVGGSKFYGSVQVGENAYIAGAVVRNQIVIGENAFVGMGSVVIRNILPGEKVRGCPARTYE